MSDQAKEIPRRQFIIGGASTLATAAAMRVQVPASTHAQVNGPSPQNNLEDPKRRVLHIVAYSHIDAAWLWPWRDGSNIALTTMRSALDRINETPGLRYSHSSAIHYSWVERADPAMFDEIRQRAREGRWEVVGGWPVEPDCNIPATESFVRHCLYGKDYFRRKFSIEVNIGLNPDSFGHAAGLPSILKGAGYQYYVFMRPQEHEMKLPLLFWWEAPDGSRILTLRIRRGYSMSAERISDAAQNNFAAGFNHAVYFLGVGDHGGAVTREQIQSILKQQQDSTLPELRWSTVAEFFAAVEKSPAISNLPVIRTELQHHARGCYSAHGEGKQLNRRAERWLVQAETTSVAAKLHNNHMYPGQEYASAWGKVLFNQFHDLMAGTALNGAYQDSRDSLGWACETALTNRVEALESMARRVDLRAVKEGAVFLFNPLPWTRKALVEYHTDKDPSVAPWAVAPKGAIPNYRYDDHVFGDTLPWQKSGANRHPPLFNYSAHKLIRLRLPLSVDP